MKTVRAEVDWQRIAIHCSDRDRELIQLVPGAKFDEQLGAWVAPQTWGTCQALRGVFGKRLEVGPELRDWALHELAARVRPCLKLKGAQDAPGTDWLRGLQRVGSAFLRVAGGALLADDMGAGKTVQVADALAELDKDALPALIVAPKSVKSGWARELAKRAPHLRVVVVPEGPASARSAAIRSGADIVVVHWDQLPAHSRLSAYGSVPMMKCKEHKGKPDGKYFAATPAKCHVHPKDLNMVQWRTIVADEAHRMCNTDNQWTRALWYLRDGPGTDVRYAWALTGTPQEDAPDDLWSILHFVAPDEWPTKTAYIDRYCKQGYSPWGGINVVGLNPMTEDEFRKVFEPRYLRRTFREMWPNVPEPVHEVREVVLPAKLRKQYDQMKQEHLAFLRSLPKGEEGIKQLVAWDPLSETTRLNQMALAQLVHEGDDRDGKPIWRLADPSPKIDELLVVLGELGTKPLVVYSPARQLLELAAKRLTKAKITHASITGAVSEAGRNAAEDAFNAGEARVLFLSDAGAEGLNLGVADTLVYLSRSWSLKKNSQAGRRIVRPESAIHDSLLVIDIVTADTIEQARLDKLEGKADRVEATFRDRDRLIRLIEEGVIE